MRESLDIESLQAENALLRGQLAALEADKQRLACLLQSTIDQVDALIYLRDERGAFNFVNETWVRATGLARESVLGKVNSEVFAPEVVEEFRVADRQVVERREVVEKEELLPLDDGDHLFRSLKFPLIAADGAFLGVGGISTDVTRQRRIEASLKTTELILQAIIENAPLLILATDREGRYILVGQEAARVIGRPQQEIVGQFDFEIAPQPLARNLRAQAQTVFETGRPLIVEQIVENGDQRRIFLATRFPIRDSSGTIYAVGTISADVTALRGAEGEKMRLQQEMIRAQEFTLLEMATPVVPIADGALAVPLIGTLAGERMQQIVATLLGRISGRRVKIVILDLTGVRQVDTASMHALLQATRAIRLLGVQAVLTGIQSDMAQIMVGLDIPLQQVTILQTLQHGIEYALARLRKPADR